MAQKKNKKIVRKTWYILGVVLLIIAYYFIAPNDFEKQVQTLYTSLTEIEENGETDNNLEENSNYLDNLEIYFWDVGQADCILVCCDGKYMLIDAGNNADGKLIEEQLKEMEITKIDYLIGTHPHEDHIGGLDNIIRSFKIGKFYMPNRQANSATFEDVLDAAINKNLKIVAPNRGTTFNLGEAECKVLSAESDAEDTNDSSIVIQLTFGKHKYLFTGDLTSTLEERIEWEDIDVLKVAHHGSRYSSSKTFLDATSPEIAIISDGKNNDYGHPHQETLKRLKVVNSEVYRTDKKGTIHLSSDGKEISINFLDISLDGNRK
ncbi:MAG: MBL fold metallo-hydrolase [Clostridia bacterium]|nr:MBL fold metallo-hydrolase [Clostridia bacterium]